MEELTSIKRFETVPSDHLRTLVHEAHELSVQRGEHVFRQDDILDHYFLLRSGCVRLYRLGHEGHEKIYQEIRARSEEHTSELQSRENLVCRLLLEKKKITARQ